MKLHIYAFISKPDDSAGVDCPVPASRQIAHWCNHPSLFNYFESVYLWFGGEKDLFRDAAFRLPQCKLDEFEEMVTNGNLPRNIDWLYGDADLEAAETYERFIRHARKAMSKGWEVYIRAA